MIRYFISGSRLKAFPVLKNNLGKQMKQQTQKSDVYKLKFVTKAPGLISVKDNTETVLLIVRMPGLDTAFLKSWTLLSFDSAKVAERTKANSNAILPMHASYATLKAYVLENMQAINVQHPDQLIYPA